MNKKTIEEYVEGLPESNVIFRVRVGRRANPPTVGSVCVEGCEAAAKRRVKCEPVVVEDRADLAYAIEDMAADAGYPDEHPTIRIDPHTAEGRAGTSSYTCTQKNSGDQVASSNAIAIETLCSTVVSMARIQTKTIDVLTDTLAHREETMEQAIEALVQARSDQSDAEAESIATALIAEAQEPETDPLKEAAARTLEGIVAHLAQNGAGSPELTAESVIGILEANPQLAVDLARDPRVVDLVMRAAVTPPEQPTPKKKTKKAPRGTEN